MRKSYITSFIDSVGSRDLPTFTSASTPRFIIPKMFNFGTRRSRQKPKHRKRRNSLEDDFDMPCKFPYPLHPSPSKKLTLNKQWQDTAAMTPHVLNSQSMNELKYSSPVGFPQACFRNPSITRSILSFGSRDLMSMKRCF